jgi:manganese/zinc/iron transport system permease protein
LVCTLLFKELKLLCFDEEFAATQGWPVGVLELVLMGLVVLVAVVGMPSAGLLLVVAMLIVPPAGARFWTDDLRRMTLLAAAAGCVSAALAVVVSATYSQLPTGPLIVLAGSVFFVGSLLFGTRHGVVRRWLTHWRLARRIGRHDLLRALYEVVEQSAPGGVANLEAMVAREVPAQRLLAKRSWTPRRLRRLIASADRAGLVRLSSAGDAVHLTAAGLAEARHIIRNHRLWEMYLIAYADIAPSHVDRSADRIEHVLDAEIIFELENRLAQQHAQMQVPPSPHVIGSNTG